MVDAGPWAAGKQRGNPGCCNLLLEDFAMTSGYCYVCASERNCVCCTSLPHSPTCGNFALKCCWRKKIQSPCWWHNDSSNYHLQKQDSICLVQYVVLGKEMVEITFVTHVSIIMKDAEVSLHLLCFLCHSFCLPPCAVHLPLPHFLHLLKLFSFVNPSFLLLPLPLPGLVFSTIC